jgi:hypothetical protein
MRRLVADLKKRVEVEKDVKGITAKHYFSAIKNFCLINNTGITVNCLDMMADATNTELVNKIR